MELQVSLAHSQTKHPPKSDVILFFKAHFKQQINLKQKQKTNPGYNQSIKCKTKQV